MRAYHEDIAACRVIRLPEVWQRIACMPAARFYVSEERAAVVVSKMLKGDRLETMRPLKREMYEEICRRVQLLLDIRPELSVSQCCMLVVNAPAPKFYMTPLSIRETIYKIKRQWYSERKKTVVQVRTKAKRVLPLESATDGQQG